MDYKNFQHAWQHLIETCPERPYLKIPTAEGQLLSYKIESFYRRAVKIATAFSEELSLEPGDRVALLVDEPNDYALLLHGCWLAQLTAVPLTLDYVDDVIVSLLNNCNVKAVAFSPSASARIALMFERTYSVKHWVVTSGGIGAAGGEIRKLDELLSDIRTPNLPELADDAEHVLGLVALSGGSVDSPRGVGFDHQQLLSAGTSMLGLHAKNGGLSRAALPCTSFRTIAYSLVGALFTDSYCLFDNPFEAKEFWERVLAEDLSAVLIDQDFLRVLNRKGKPKDWSPPNAVSIHLCSHTPIASELLATFEKRFESRVWPVYMQTEAGGLVTAFPENCQAEYVNKWLYEYYLPSSGVSVDGVEVSVVDLEGSPVGEEVLGEIIVTGSQVMRAYSGTTPGDAYFGQGGVLHTGDEGFYVSDESGREHLFVTGRLSEVISRNGERINPAKIDSHLYAIEGVEFALAVGFPNHYSGYEIGAYVVPSRGASLAAATVLSALRRELDWTECPKKIVIGERAKDGNYPTRADLVKLFSDQHEIDFSQG